MRRVAAGALLLGVGLLLAAGCGGDGSATNASVPAGSTSEDGSVTVAAPAWAAPLLRKAGPEGAVIMASSDFAIGENRLGFLIVRADGSEVRAPTADVYYRPTPAGPTRKAVARLVNIGVAATATQKDEIRQLYVVRLALPQAGKSWIVVQPRQVAFQGFQILDVKERPAAVGVGEHAPASRNPTTATRPAQRITTARPPDVGLLRHSVADSLSDNAPFVVVFATPLYCQTRTCGPSVDVLDAVRMRFETRGIRFIHIEIYEDNIPGNGLNQWVKEWKLSTEPWVFVVDRTGVVRDRFEGAVSVGELEDSIRRTILE